ncbi:3-keto-5-aminohexanoate cleavage protein [Desulfococcaceae bacterium HSG8]|nr:3-keto-5-aminohexanoate cleavage protein [Desulfococcaceae bacterium HSG8]
MSDTEKSESGGHVRVGIEDNFYYRKGEPAKSNAQLVGWCGSRVR